MADIANTGLGTLGPTGGLPSVDIEGHSRKSLNNKVDLGAYERGDEIFKDGLKTEVSNYSSAWVA